MEKELKVGHTFEVVEVLYSNFNYNEFKVGGWTVSFTEHRQLLNGTNNNSYDKTMGQNTLCLPYNGTKKVGKLTVTKVK